jgi:uncharacterized Rossmann fold enzyme
MAKVDKSKYTKAQWKIIKEQRRQEKSAKLQSDVISKPKTLRTISNEKCSFVLGNGTSRKSIDLHNLKKHGKIYACNAVYRTFTPDYLVAVDVKMILEINKSGYQHRNEVWTNPNKSYQRIQNLNYFSPSKGWSSGPTALWLAAEHGYETIYILGFDFRGLNDGKQLNNLYADTVNYKKSTDSATFFGNWMRQTKTVIKSNSKINFVRVIQPDNYNPEELNTFDNYSTIFVEDFKKMFNIS